MKRLGLWMETDDGHVVPATDFLEFAKWAEKHDPQVALTRVRDITVSTVFLAVNHRHAEGPPLVYETMAVSSSREILEARRYSTRAEALAGHAHVVCMMECR